MLEKHSAATTSRCHEQHDHYNSSSPEPRLKIKISRLKDGSASFSLHNGFTNSGDSPKAQRSDCNGARDYDRSQGEVYDDGEETEEEDYDAYDCFNHVSKRPRLDSQEVQPPSPKNGQHRTYDERPNDKSSDKENKMALRTRSSRSRAAEERSGDSKAKTCPRKTNGKKSVGCSTEGSLLGPCQPGTLIKLPGLVWSESSENGMLLFKTTWKDKPFVGMLMEVSQGDDWSISKSRVFASCPGSRYKRKCKKPREFRYVDGWQKKGKNLRHRTKLGLNSSRNCSEVDSQSNNEDETSLDLNQYLVCAQKGCGKKFINEVARGYHFSHAHCNPPGMNEDREGTNVPRQYRSNGHRSGDSRKRSSLNLSSAFDRQVNSISQISEDRLPAEMSESSRRKRKSSQSSDDSTHLSSVASMAWTSDRHYFSNNALERHGRAPNDNPQVEDISDDENQSVSNSVFAASDTFYTSSLNPTSLVIRRALKPPTSHKDVQIIRDGSDNNSRKLYLNPKQESSNRDKFVFTSSGFSSPIYSSPTAHPLMCPQVMEKPPRSPGWTAADPSSTASSSVATPSWLDHYPHSISAALTMSLLSMSKTSPDTKLHDIPAALGQPAESELVQPPVIPERQELMFDDISKHSSDDSLASITTEFCDVNDSIDLTPVSPTAADGAPKSAILDPSLSGSISQDDNVPKMSSQAATEPDANPGAPDSTDDQKPNCVSPVYSDISDTVDRAPLFANPSKAFDAKSPEANESWSALVSPPYYSNQCETLPQVNIDQNKVVDWLNRSAENGECGSYYEGSGYTSYLQQILCNKEKFYMSLAFSSPSNSPRRLNPGQENPGSCDGAPAREDFEPAGDPDRDGAT